MVASSGWRSCHSRCQSKNQNCLTALNVNCKPEHVEGTPPIHDSPKSGGWCFFFFWRYGRLGRQTLTLREALSRGVSVGTWSPYYPLPLGCCSCGVGM